MTLPRWAIERVILLYPPEYRAARGDDIRNGLDEASHDAAGLQMLGHVVSVAVHAWQTRAKAATEGRRFGALRQGLALAIVVSLAAAITDGRGWDGWPNLFATGLLLAGAWMWMANVGRGGRLIGLAAVLIAGRNFSDLHAITIPLIGQYSAGIVLLVFGLRIATAGSRPGRHIGAVAAVGVGLSVLSGSYPSTQYLLPALMVAGLLIGLVDPRSAIAVAALPLLVTATRFNWMVDVGLAQFAWQVAAALCIASLMTFVHFRGNMFGGEAEPG
ncbi:MAG: hypothetical protein WB239_17215 [Acidimicrobiia bacterium]